MNFEMSRSLKNGAKSVRILLLKNSKKTGTTTKPSLLEALPSFFEGVFCLRGSRRNLQIIFKSASSNDGIYYKVIAPVLLEFSDCY